MKFLPLKLAAIALAAAFLLPGCAKKEVLDIQGTWRINPDKTVTMAVAEGLVPPEQVASMVQSIGRRIERSQITVTGDKVVTSEYEAAYEVTYESGSEMVLRLEITGEPITLTFTDIDGISIHIRSSATDDMDFLVWNKDFD